MVQFAMFPCSKWHLNHSFSGFNFLICFLFSLCCVIVLNDVNVGLVFKGSCGCFMLILAVRLRLFDVDRIVAYCMWCLFDEQIKK